MPVGLNLALERRVYAGFMLHAIMMGSIFPRMPDIKQALDVGEGTLGFALIGVPAGTMLALTIAAPYIEKLGFRRTLLTAIPLVALLYAIAVHAIGPKSLFAMLVPIGFIIGCIEIVLNVEADRTEAFIKRRIMNRAHSFWSIGFFLTGLFGAGMAHYKVSPQIHLALMVPIALAGTAILLGKFQPSPTRTIETDQERPKFALPSLPILALVAVTISAMLMEGAGIDWSAIYMHNIFNSGPFIAGFAVSVVTFTQAITRFFADSHIEKHSPSSVSRVLSIVMLGGILLVFFAISPIASLLGFALIGVGTSVMFPLAVSAAAQLTDRPSAINVASLVQTSFMIFLLGPPLLGYVGEHLGMWWTYGVGAPLAVLSVLTSKALNVKTAQSHL
jgi:MFS family permease